jgi:hypothetical protein
MPFPAWDGIFQLAHVVGELRREKMFAGIPECRTPRRTSIWEKTPRDGFDNVAVVEYWYTGGFEVIATLGGTEDKSCGTGWVLVGLRISWRAAELGLAQADEKVTVRLNAEQVANVGSAAVVAELAAPVRAAWERQQIWLETMAAAREGREFSWLPGFGPESVPALVPVMDPPEWEKEVRS